MFSFCSYFAMFDFFEQFIVDGNKTLRKYDNN